MDAETSARFKERIVAGTELERDGVVAFRGVDAQRILKEEFDVDCSLSSTSKQDSNPRSPGTKTRDDRLRSLGGEVRVAEDARFDGLYVLRTNTKLTPLQVMLRYRDLLRVEQLFRCVRRS